MQRFYRTCKKEGKLSFKVKFGSNNMLANLIITGSWHGFSFLIPFLLLSFIIVCHEIRETFK